MIVKAMENFSGKIAMSIGQVRDIPEGETLTDLLQAGYVTAVDEQPKKAARKKSGT
ncbi:MAG: hypothetical protein KHW88_08895 [Lachnospiraceae bacterium]|nr:hypothetical protein [Lachnospiraceae bacterium]